MSGFTMKTTYINLTSFLKNNSNVASKEKARSLSLADPDEDQDRKWEGCAIAPVALGLNEEHLSISWHLLLWM
jgi:hypothetical protein